MPDPQALRGELRARRRALDAGSLREHGARIRHRLRLSATWQRARCVGLYWPTDNEPDLLPLASHSRAGRRAFLLPRIDPRAEHFGHMQLLPWQPGQPLRRNRWGIPEPLRGRPALPDLLLLPLVGFDANGTRLGMGAGFYDRYLAGLRRRPTCIGIAHACQQVDALPRRAWDMPLDAVLTECGWIHCKEMF